MTREVPQLLDSHGRPLEPSRPAARAGDFGGAPYMPDGAWNYGFYDAVNYSANRAARPYFATDSRYTLTQWSRLRALSLARWAYINVAPVKGAVDLMARLTVGTGFAPKTLCADKGLAKAADDSYAAQVRNIGFMAGESLDELLLHDCRCVDVDGDKLDILTADEFGQPKLQFVEGHRIKTGNSIDPNCRDGVFVDGYGRRTAYNVALPGDDQTRRIEARDALYMAERNRPDELRSITNLIHALAPLQDLYEILNFAMLSVKKNTEIALVIKTDTPNDAPLGPTYSQILSKAQPAGGDGQPAQPASFVTREQIFASGGKIPILRPNESLESYAHAQPAANIESWAEFIIRCVAIGFGVPFEILWNPEAIGGANTRLITALLRARLVQRRNSLIFPKLTRIRFWLLSKEIKRGGLFTTKQVPLLLAHAWQPKFSDITVDAGRESKERRSNVMAGLDTYTGYYAENGETYTDQARIRGNDVALQCAIATELCAKFPKLDFKTALLHMATITQSGKEMGDGSGSSSSNE